MIPRAAPAAPGLVPLSRAEVAALSRRPYIVEDWLRVDDEPVRRAPDAAAGLVLLAAERVEQAHRRAWATPGIHPKVRREWRARDAAEPLVLEWRDAAGWLRAWHERRW